MTDRCHAIERLPEIAERSPDDVDRLHLDSCPRCQARLSDFRDFMAGGSAVPTESLDEAMKRLERLLVEEIHPDVKPFRTPPGRPFLNRPAVRGALALAAVLLLAFSLNGFWEGRPSEEIRLRAPAGEGATSDFEPGSARRLVDGSFELSWQGFPRAEDYVVRILGADLTLLAELPAGEATRLNIESARLQELLGGEILFAWQVLARHGGDTIARSAVAAQRLDEARAP